MNERPFQFEWNEVKADANLRKHGITFELASTIFLDPNLLTVGDLEHSATEDRVFCRDRGQRRIAVGRLSVVR